MASRQERDGHRTSGGCPHHKGAGAYICGEETALMNSLEGRRGTRASSRLPGGCRLFGQPTTDQQTWRRSPPFRTS